MALLQLSMLMSQRMIADATTEVASAHTRHESSMSKMSQAADLDLACGEMMGSQCDAAGGLILHQLLWRHGPDCLC